MIRRAATEDIPTLLDMGSKFHAMSDAPFQFDRATMAAVLGKMIETDAAVVLMTDRGVIGGVLNPAYCDPDWIMAVELFWWAEGDGMRLLRSFEEWAEKVGASEVRMTSLASLPRADALLKRNGYEQREISYSKVV